MTYEFNRKASQEAEARALDNEKLVRVRSQVQAMVGEMAPDGVRGHKIGFHRQAWGGLEDVLTSEILERQEITRGEVFAIAEEVRSGARPPTHLLAASFLWGSGTTGYGAARWNKIIEAGEEQIEGALTRGLAEAQEDPIAGYTAFFGGTEWDQRENPFTKPWARINGLGPAFFTKVLYFSTPGALILDNRLANAVHTLSEIPFLVRPNGSSYAWSPYRYAVYLHWMRLTAEQVDTQPDVLERTLFTPQRGVSDVEGDAAD